MADSVKTIEEEYEELAGDNTYYELAEVIGRMSDREKADSFTDLLLEEFLYPVFNGYWCYNRHPVLNEEDTSFVKGMIDQSSLDFYIIRAFLAFDEGKETECLQLIGLYFEGLKSTENPFSEVDFCQLLLERFKNAFPGFWETVYECLLTIPHEKEIPDLCQTVKLFYEINDYGQQKEILLKHLDKYPESVSANDLLILRAQTAKDWDMIIQHLDPEKSHDLFNTSSCYTILAYAYSKKRKFAESAQLYEKCLKLYPDLPNVLNNLGLQYLDGKEYDKALAVFRRCMDEDRDSLYAPNNYVRTLLKMKRYAEADDFIKNTKFYINDELVKRTARYMEKAAVSKDDSGAQEDITAETETVDEDQNSTSSESDTAEETEESKILGLLEDPDEETRKMLEDNQKYADEKALLLMDTLKRFRINASLLSVTAASAVTRFEIRLNAGERISRIKRVKGDLQYALGTDFLNMEAPIPGKNAIGIDIPSRHVIPLSFKSVMKRALKECISSTVCVGESLTGDVPLFDLQDLENALITGSNDAERNMFLQSFIVSLMLNSSPSEIRIVLADISRAEYAAYKSEPHLLYSLINNGEDCIAVLQDLRKEVEIRMNLFAKKRVRNLDGYNNICRDEKDMLPRIVVIMNNYSEFISMNYGTINSLVAQLIEYSVSAGIHVVLSMTRASSDIIPTDLKNNFNTRVSFMVPSGTDSRTALTTSFARDLMGDGEMLIALSDGLYEYHGMVTAPSDQEISNTVKYMINTYGTAQYRYPEERLIIEEPKSPLYRKMIQFISVHPDLPADELYKEFGLGYSRKEETAVQPGKEVDGKPQQSAVNFFTADKIKTADHSDPDFSIHRFTGQFNTINTSPDLLDDYSIIDEKNLNFYIWILGNEVNDVEYAYKNRRITRRLYLDAVNRNEKKHFFRQDVKINYTWHPGAHERRKKLTDLFQSIQQSQTIMYLPEPEESVKMLENYKFATSGAEMEECIKGSGFKPPLYASEDFFSITFDGKEILFCPDAVYIHSGKTYRAYSYRNINFTVQIYNIMDDALKLSGAGFSNRQDAYLYAKNDGTPDLRYKDNEGIPFYHSWLFRIQHKNWDYAFLCSNIDVELLKKY